MSKNKTNQDQNSVQSAEDRKVNRRRFMSAFAVGAGLAPLASVIGNRASAFGGQQVNDLCFGTPNAITPNDLRYLGALRVPSGVKLDYSNGSLTGRRVGNELRLFLAGHVLLGGPVVELGVNAEPSSNQLAAPRIRLVRNWGDVYGGKRVSWDQNGNLRTVFRPANLHWNERNQLLYWTYYDTYNVIHVPDWSLGASRLNADGTATAFGPWRTFGEGKFGSWRTINLAENPIDGSMLCGSKIQSGNSGSPWGPDLWRGQYPTASTPAGQGAADIHLSKYVTYYLQSVSQNGSFGSPIRSCRRPGTYIFEPTTNTEKTEIDPTKNNGTGTWTSLDMANGMTWIDLPEKRGVIFSGRFATGHVWYSNVALGSASCTHGIYRPQGITGPVASGGHPMLAFYDISDLEAVAAGRLTDYTVQPTFVNAEQTWGCKSAAIARDGTFGSFGSCFFDPIGRRLYAVAPEADDTGGLVNLLPLIHVWDIV